MYWERLQNNTVKNCGILEVHGSITGSGGSGLENYCSIYVHQDISLNGDFTSDGLIIIDGDLSVNGSIFYNNSTLILTNLNLTNDQIVGNQEESLLIVRQNAQLSNGASITGHWFYDVDDGGGFDSVCGSCTEDVDIVNDAIIPPTTEEILANCGGDIIINPFIEESKIDFDGVDDYVSTPEFIDGLSDVTIMAWVKSDTGNSTHMTIAGEDSGCRLWLKNGAIPAFTIRGLGLSEKSLVSGAVINHDEWHHISGTYTKTTGAMKLFVDGALVNTTTVSATGAVINNTTDSNGNFEIGRRSSNIANKQYFKGDIDEVRVFNTVLTQDQISRMVYQEIKNNSGVVRGAMIAKDIVDINTNATISWSSLLAYYPFSNIISSTRTTDFSLYDRITKIHNITTFQDETAPLPYVTASNGCWCNESTWLHGDVWDIENASDNKDWSIVQISNNVSTSNSHSHLGLIIDADKSLTVYGDNLIENSWYLELNGALDLMGDSQLLQTENSDLVTSADGKILRRQEGQANPYRYNYWASPVGFTGVSTLSDNNTGNNANNTTFSLNMLKDETGSSCLFTSGQTGNGKISTQWIYTFINGLTYWDWAQISPSTSLKPGVGYTQKGMGNVGAEQQYIFEGKPNNGTILLNVTDKGGAGSVPNKTKTEYLLGNPYASAIDIHKFIDDNAGVIDGTLQLWQQWAGNSHYLNEYQGGYAQVNKLGSCRAYQFVGFYGDHNGSQDGTIVPSRYLSVGQGFMAEIVADGQVEFNNGQRVFIKESDADGTYDNGSTFSKPSNGKKAKQEASSDSMQKIRLEFNSVTGPKTRRELLMGFSDYTSDGFDYGYDAKNTGTNNNDLNLSLEGKNMIMQAYGEITDEKVVPLNLRSSGNHTFEIMISEKEHIKESQKIYLRDNLTGEYFNLTKGDAYQFSSEAGMFKNRLEIVFQSEQQMLSAEEADGTKNRTYYQNPSKTFYAKNMDSEVKRFVVVDMRGREVLDLSGVSNAQLETGIRLNRLATGTYVVCLRTENNAVLTKKIVVD